METVAQIDKYFQLTITENASDLHMPSGSPPRIRVHGDLKQLNHPPLTHEQNKTLLIEIMNERALTEFKAKRQVDFVYAFGTEARFRSNVFMERHGISGSFRLIPSKILSVEDLGLSEPVVNLCSLKKGLVLVTGPTGSGKSTTLATMIDLCNRTRKDHIITVEDSIEFVYQNKSCLVS
jgi:twitching motility protein PilT